MIWRKVFDIDKNTTVGFMKVKYDLDIFKREVNNKLDNIGDKLDNIEKLIRNRK